MSRITLPKAIVDSTTVAKGITVPIPGPQRADVHVLELDNDEYWQNDDCYVWSYSVPEPDLL